MEGWEDQVIATISNPIPRAIFKDSSFPERNIYYRRHSGKGYYYIKVVVDFMDEKIGKVITAHPSDSMKTGKVLIWP